MLMLLLVSNDVKSLFKIFIFETAFPRTICRVVQTFNCGLLCSPRVTFLGALDLLLMPKCSYFNTYVHIKLYNNSIYKMQVSSKYIICWMNNIYEVRTHFGGDGSEELARRES